MKVSELEGAELDYWVAKAEGWEADWKPPEHPGNYKIPGFGWSSSAGWNWSTDWSQGGPIIERETIQLNPGNAFPNCTVWWAKHPAHGWTIVSSGETPLIAAMRCFVASKFGEEVG